MMPKGYSRDRIPNRIAFWRERRGFTQGQLAARLYRQRTTLANWETGMCTPPPEILPILARLLRVSVNDLFPR